MVMLAILRITLVTQTAGDLFMSAYSPEPTAPSTKTMLLQIGTSWAVCTRTPVPIILARFPKRQDAVLWQSDHENRVNAKAA